MVRFYPAVIERGRSGFGVFFPDLPGCTSAGDTLQEAAENAEEALHLHIGLGVEYGDVIPAPSRLDDIDVDAEVVEAARILVRIDIPQQPVHIDVLVPGDLVRLMDELVRSRGGTRASVTVDAIRSLVGVDVPA